LADEKDVFLNLEKQATDIINELNQLKTETDHYSNSAKSLDDAIKMIEKLTSALEKNTGELSNLCKSIREGGFQSLEKNLDKLSNATTNTNTSVNDFLQKTDINLDKLTSENTKTNSSINHLDQKIQVHSGKLNLLTGFVIIITILQLVSFII